MTFPKKLLLTLFILVVLGLLVSPILIPKIIFSSSAAGPAQLEELHERLLILFTIPGTVYTDVLEGENRFEVGVTERELFRGVKKELHRLGVQRGMVDIVLAKPILPMVTLREKVRPLQGGLQIAFSNFLCTLGFNAVRSGVEGFVVNSHCTDKEGTVEDTAHYQPAAVAENLIGTETVDPAFFRGGSCPKGRRCRRSDSAYDERAAGVSADLGLIERTESVNTKSINIAGSFRVVDEASSNAPVGETLNKVGRTTGWSQGKVSKSCANTAVSGTNIVQLCQDWVKATVGAGDSGSSVFKVVDSPQKDDVQLYGILWGGTSDGTTFVYSPMVNIQRSDELGPLTNCASGFSC